MCSPNSLFRWTEYTQMFFGWQNPQFQYSQRNCFAEAFSALAQIARAVNPAQYLNKSWNSFRTKVVDNALVGLLQWVKAHALEDSRSQATTFEKLLKLRP